MGTEADERPTLRRTLAGSGRRARLAAWFVAHPGPPRPETHMPAAIATACGYTDPKGRLACFNELARMHRVGLLTRHRDPAPPGRVRPVTYYSLSPVHLNELLDPTT